MNKFDNMPRLLRTRFISFFFFSLTTSNAFDSSTFTRSVPNDANDALRVSSILQQQQQRHLQGIGGCPFADLVSFSETCTLSEYCVTTSPSTAIECGGELIDRWAIRVEQTLPRCYNDPNNRNVFFFPDSTTSTTLPAGGYCSSTRLIFQFINGNVLASVESDEIFTAPDDLIGKTLYSLRTVQVCNVDDSDADWASFGSVPYCYDNCPSDLVVDGDECQVACLSCDDDDGGRQSFSCPNLYPFFRYDCLNSELQNNFYSEVIARFNQGDVTGTPTQAPFLSLPPTRTPTAQPTTSAPVANPTGSPTRAPVDAPVADPTRFPTLAPQTSAPSTPLYTPTPTEVPTLPREMPPTTSKTTTSPTDVPTFSPTAVTEEPSKVVLVPPTAPIPDKRTVEPTRVLSSSQTPTEESVFFVEGPIELSPVFLSSNASTRWGCAVMSFCLLWIWIL